MPDRSGMPSTAQAWLPLAQMPGLARERRRCPDASGIRPACGTVPSHGCADARSKAVFDRLHGDHPQTNEDIRARVVPINEQFLGRLSDPAWRAFITVGFLVLAISCANVANLFLNHSVERTREIAIRTALGRDPRQRVVRQLLIEASVLAATSAVVGLGVAAAGVRLFRGLIPDNVLPLLVRLLDRRTRARHAARRVDGHGPGVRSDTRDRAGRRPTSIGR